VVIQITYWGRNMENPHEEKVYRLKCVVSGYLEPGDSHFWAGLMATKKFCFPYGSFSIKDRSKIRFWMD
jgi:hypothetical protein